MLERLGSSGAIGDEVNVKNGFARNYLLPQGKAVRATSENRAYFESRRAEILKADTDRLVSAQARGEALVGVEITISGRTTEEGRLYGSIGSREICSELSVLAIKLNARKWTCRKATYVHLENIRCDSCSTQK